MSSSNAIDQWVAAADIGTSSTCLKLSMKDGDDWREQAVHLDSSNRFKSSSCVLLKRDLLGAWKLSAFGDAAVLAYKAALEHSASGDAASLRLVDRYKMGLRPGKVAPRLRRDVGEFKAYPLAMARTRANQIPLMDVFVALLTHLHQKAANAVKGVKDDKATKAIMTKMKWVLTVPAIWDADAINFMRQAAIKAGLITALADDAARLQIIAEPEAAAIAALSRNAAVKREMLVKDKVVMVVDAGSGTVDITVGRIVSTDLLSLAEVISPGGGPFGASSVQYTAWSFICKKFGADEKSGPARQAYLYMRDDIENLLIQYQNDMGTRTSAGADAKPYPLKVDPLVHALNCTEEQLGKLNIRGGISGRTILLTSTQIKPFFRASTAGTGKEITRILREPDARGISAVMVVGGYSASKMFVAAVQAAVAEVYPSRLDFVGLSSTPHDVVAPAVVTMPEGEHATAIAAGALEFAKSSRAFVTSRIVRYNFGYEALTGVQFPPVHGRAAVRDYGPPAGRQANVICGLVAAGERKQVNDCVEVECQPVLPDQTSVSIEFVRTAKQVDFSKLRTRPCYLVDDPDPANDCEVNSSEKIGEVTVDCPTAASGKSRKIKVRLFFGRTEIVAEAESIDDKKPVTLQYAPPPPGSTLDAEDAESVDSVEFDHTLPPAREHAAAAATQRHHEQDDSKSADRWSVDSRNVGPTNGDDDTSSWRRGGSSAGNFGTDDSQQHARTAFKFAFVANNSAVTRLLNYSNSHNIELRNSGSQIIAILPRSDSMRLSWNVILLTARSKDSLLVLKQQCLEVVSDGLSWSKDHIAQAQYFRGGNRVALDDPDVRSTMSAKFPSAVIAWPAGSSEAVAEAVKASLADRRAAPSARSFESIPADDEGRGNWLVTVSTTNEVTRTAHLVAAMKELRQFSSSRTRTSAPLGSPAQPRGATQLPIGWVSHRTKDQRPQDLYITGIQGAKYNAATVKTELVSAGLAVDDVKMAAPVDNGHKVALVAFKTARDAEATHARSKFQRQDDSIIEPIKNKGWRVQPADTNYSGTDVHLSGFDAMCDREQLLMAFLPLGATNVVTKSQANGSGGYAFISFESSALASAVVAAFQPLPTAERFEEVLLPLVKRGWKFARGFEAGQLKVSGYDSFVITTVDPIAAKLQVLGAIREASISGSSAVIHFEIPELASAMLTVSGRLEAAAGGGAYGRSGDGNGYRQTSASAADGSGHRQSSASAANGSGHRQSSASGADVRTGQLPRGWQLHKPRGLTMNPNQALLTDFDSNLTDRELAWELLQAGVRAIGVTIRSAALSGRLFAVLTFGSDKDAKDAFEAHRNVRPSTYKLPSASIRFNESAQEGNIHDLFMTGFDEALTTDQILEGFLHLGAYGVRRINPAQAFLTFSAANRKGIVESNPSQRYRPGTAAANGSGGGGAASGWGRSANPTPQPAINFGGGRY